MYLVTPVTYEADKADDEAVAQAFDKLVQAGAARGGLEECGRRIGGVRRDPADGDNLPIGIE